MPRRLLAFLLAFAPCGLFAAPALSASIFPLTQPLVDFDGHTIDLLSIGKPIVIVPADFTCKTLCGPILSFAGHALEDSGLVAGEDYRLVVLGLDPKDKAEEANALTSQIGDPRIIAKTILLHGDAQTVAAIGSALGYEYQYDAASDQFTHPAAVYVLTKEGDVSRALSGIGLSGADMRLAIVEAGAGQIGGIADTIHLLCSSFDPVRGIYNLAVSRIVTGTALLTIISLATLIGLLAFAGRRRPA